MIAIFNPAKSPYALAVDNGFTGTVEEWLASLEGQRGPPGASYVENPENLCRVTISSDQVTVILSDLENNPITTLPYVP